MKTAEQQILLDQRYKLRETYNNTDFTKPKDFYHVLGEKEPHIIRRKMILEAHPEIRQLFGYDHASIWVALAIILSQLISVQFFSKLSIFQYRNLNQFFFYKNSYILSAYIVGGTITHSSQILIHDLTHFLCFENISYNKYLAIAVNIVSGVPSAIAFGKYHSDHHIFMNVKGKDPDLPSEWEIRNLNTSFRKFLFIFFQAFFYGLRPIITQPKQIGFYELINIVIVMSSNYCIYLWLGSDGLVWIILGALLGIGFHPTAGHTIAEHYEFEQGLETMDYIGSANFFNINVGYHIEHHDFPMIPWTMLPLVRKIAPEFYEQYPHHTSYIKVFYLYIFNKNIGPFSRIIRKSKVN